MTKSEARKVWWFFVLAYAITWAFAIPAALLTPPDTEPNPFDIGQLGALGPAIAAIVLTYRDGGREGLREYFGRVLKWRVRWIWYLVALLLPLVRGTIPIAATYGLLNGSLPPLAEPAHGAPPWPHTAWFFFYILLIGGGQEELGWRGYALPKLQTRWNATVASVIVGTMWALWHLPMTFIPGSSLHRAPFVPFLLVLIAQSVAFTWLYNSTGSILLCILLHTWSNFAAAYLTVDVIRPGYGLLALGAQLTVVIVLLAIFGPRRLSSRCGQLHTMERTVGSQ